MARPLTSELPPRRTRPLVCSPAKKPLIATNGVPLKPGCVVPSMVTGAGVLGRGDAGKKGGTPPKPGMLRLMVLPGLALALTMAARRLSAPLSLVLRTVNVAGAKRSSRASREGRNLGTERERTQERGNQRRRKSL